MTEARLGESEQRYRHLVEQCVDGIFIAAADNRLEEANTAVCVMFGLSREELLSKSISDLIAPEQRQAVLASIAAISHDGIVRSEWLCQRQDGATFSGEFVGRRFADARLQGVLRDVTERRRHLEQIKVLSQEVAHRNKNLLSVVQALAAQMDGDDPKHFQSEFAARLRSLGTSIDLLLKENWDGADLAEVARSQVAAFLGANDARLAITGPQIRLSSPATQMLGMAFHKLAANAVRFGALSDKAGRVNLQWNLRSAPHGPDFLDVWWRECGGPPIQEHILSGHSVTVLKKLVERSLDAEVELAFPDTGFVWSMRCAADSIRVAPDLPQTIRYEFRFIDHSGRVFSRSELDARNDEEAITRGRSLYRIGIGYGFQVLREGQLVHIEKFSTV